MIDHVNFTAWWPALGPKSGPWKVVCVVNPPSSGDSYNCDIDLAQLGVPDGELWVSFDVYDREGNKNLAPNGEHSLHYLSPTPTPSPQNTFMNQLIGKWIQTKVACSPNWCTDVASSLYIVFAENGTVTMNKYTADVTSSFQLSGIQMNGQYCPVEVHNTCMNALINVGGYYSVISLDDNGNLAIADPTMSGYMLFQKSS